MDIKTLRDLLVEQVQDLYSAEKQILDALPDMLDEASDPELQNALRRHLQETEGQKQRLDQVGRLLDIDPDGSTCKAMKGIIDEGEKLVMRETDDEDVRDAAIIAAAQRVEHYEIAAYGTARTFAQMLGEHEAAGLLEQSLRQEKDADLMLTGIAEGHVNRQAIKGD